MGSTLWKIGDRAIDLSRNGLIMGVLNVTPDSFSDGGQFFSTERAIDRGLQMVKEGAGIIDVGGESTRPGAIPVSEQDELARVIPVIAGLREKVSVPISVDTSKAGVAERALEAGASIVNDVTGGRSDPEMMPLIAARKAAFIIMHMQGSPETMQKNPVYNDVVSEVADFFRQQYTCALEWGIDCMGIAFDPGIGFGKTVEHNLQLLANLSHLRVDGRPIAVGVSRKSFLGKIIGSSEMGDRLAAAIALTAILRQRGAQILRVHDVKENAAALHVAERLFAVAK
jgi:dihydropteroate synthase